MVLYTRNDRSLSQPANLWRTWDSLAHQFDAFFNDFDRKAGEESATERERSIVTSAPPTDIEESSSHYELSFDMPGIKEEDLNVELNGRTLTVSGKRSRVTTDNKLHRTEKFFGEYRRTISLPENVKAEEIEANYANGVLSLRLPKAQLSGAKKIAIGKGAQAQKLEGNEQTH